MATVNIRLEEVLPRLRGIKPCGDGHTASCPAHHDMTGDTLFVLDLRDGLTELACRKGCASTAILSALEISHPESSSAVAESDEDAKPHSEGPALVADLPGPLRRPETPNVAAIKRATLTVDRIEVCDDIKPRDAISDDLTEEYAQAYRERAPMPPIEVFEDDHGTVQLADGWHRLAAQRRLGVGEVDAIVHPGDRADAMLYAAQSNVTHGRRRGPGDAVAAACVAIRGLSLKHPEKRPTHREVMGAARVGKKTVTEAFAALDEANVAVGAKDHRGGDRRRFGTDGTKDETAADPVGESVGPETPTPKTSVFEPKLEELVDVATDGGGREDQAADLIPPAPQVNAQTSSTVPSSLAVANLDRENATEGAAEAIERVHDSINVLVKHSPEHVARILDPESINLLAMTVDQLTAWWAHVEEVVSRLVADE